MTDEDARRIEFALRTSRQLAESGLVEEIRKLPPLRPDPVDDRIRALLREVFTPPDNKEVKP